MHLPRAAQDENKGCDTTDRRRAGATRHISQIRVGIHNGTTLNGAYPSIPQQQITCLIYLFTRLAVPVMRRLEDRNDAMAEPFGTDCCYA